MSDRDRNTRDRPMPPPEERGYEPDHPETARRTAIAGAALILLVAVHVGAMIWFLAILRGDRPEPPAPDPAETRLPDAPRLQVAPALDLVEIRAREYEALGTFGWVDRGDSILHIPIGHAMELIARRGLPAGDTAAVSAPVRVPTASGYRIVRRGVPAPSAPPVLQLGFDAAPVDAVLRRILEADSLSEDAASGPVGAGRGRSGRV